MLISKDQLPSEIFNYKHQGLKFPQPKIAPTTKITIKNQLTIFKLGLGYRGDSFSLRRLPFFIFNLSHDNKKNYISP